MKNNNISGLNSPLDSPSEKPLSGYVSNGGELSLSNPGQLELLQGMKERGVSLRTAVRGFSMHPLIKDRDVLTIAPLNDQQLRIGEVVAFKHPENGRLIIHRIIKRVNSGWITKGDNCLETDGLITLEQILGRVIGVERKGRRMRFCLGTGRLLIAFLNRGKGLYFINQACRLSRRSAGFVLRKLQGFSAYGVLGRRFAPPVTVTLAEESDIEAVYYHFNPSMSYQRQTPNPKVINLVAKQKNKPVGFIQLVYHPEDCHPWTGYWLFSLHVWPLHRRLGIGESLTMRVIEEAKKQEAPELMLAVFEDNKRAIGLYQKLGFDHIILPTLEPLLAEEKEKSGRRRIVMKKQLR